MFENILRAFSGAAIDRPVRSDAFRRLELIDAIAPLAAIADKFDENQLTGLAQRVGCNGPSSLHPENMILAWDRCGRPLLTVADCLKARAAIRGTMSFEDFLILMSQKP